MNLSKYNNIYFVGIGGIGMSALARYFNSKSYNVAGYDRTESSLTKELVKEGISITCIDELGVIPSEHNDSANTLVIYTPAIPVTNNQLQFFNNNDYNVVKRSKVLGMIAENYKLVGVAGTHGKTTVSSMVAHLFKNSHLDCCAFLGGIAKNFNSNLVIEDSTDWTVMEADEFDRSFLQLYPDIAVVTSMDADHLDIYGDSSELKRTFNEYVSHLKEGGKLVYKYGLDIEKDRIDSYSYSVDNVASDFYIKNMRIEEGAFHYSLHTPYRVIDNLIMNYPGRVNLENSVAASAVSVLSGLSDEEIRSSIMSFQGVVRRFDVRYKSQNKIYIDDYAHHPDELKAVISSVRELYPSKKILGIFQPHLYTRTRDFAKGFMESLSLLDELILLDIYPAREEPIVGVSSDMLVKGINIPTIRCRKEDLMMELERCEFDILLTLGAGDIDRLVGKITNFMDN